MSDDRAERFRTLLENTESNARMILDGRAADTLAQLQIMREQLSEACEIAVEISIEALDRVIVRLKNPLPEGEKIDEVMPDA